MKPSLLPGVAAVVALFVFCFTRQVLRKVLDLRAANVLSAMLAGLVYYAAFVYEDEILAGMSIPDWLLPLALPAILVLLAIAAMSRRTPQAPVKGAPRCPRLIFGLPPGARNNEPDPLPGQPSRSRPYRQCRPRNRYYVYADGHRLSDRPRPGNPDHVYPDDDQFPER